MYVSNGSGIASLIINHYDQLRTNICDLARIGYNSDSGWVSYYLHGSHTKRTGSYAATGSTTSFDVDTSGVGSAVLIHNTSGMAIITSAGAICKTYSGTSVYGLPASKCKFSSGIITIACTDSCVNNTGNHYYTVL